MTRSTPRRSEKFLAREFQEFHACREEKMLRASTSMQIFLFLLIALTPSLVWLFYFLRKDPHPEPRRKLLKVFSWGVLAALPAVIIEEGILCLIAPNYLGQTLFSNCSGVLAATFNLPSLAITFLVLFIGIALTEEVLKFLAAYNQISNDPAFDEPIDAVIYMITGALGFATAENLLIIHSSLETISAVLPPNVVGLAPLNVELGRIAVIRFFGATFLHALLAALMGFFLAYAILLPRKKWTIILGGLGIATVLHGFFNLGIIELSDRNGGFLSAGVIVLLVLVMPFLFKKVRALHAECRVPNTTIVPKVF